MRTTIQVRKLIGVECLTAQDGKQLFELLSKRIKHAKPVIVDFEGVEICTTPFFNASFGRLVEHLRPEEVHEQVRCVHIKNDAKELLQRVLENADQYFRDCDHRRAIGESTDRLLSEN